MDEVGPSRPAGYDVERGEEVSYMDRSESMGIPSSHQHTSQPRGRRPPRTDIDDLINDMGTMHVEHQVTLQITKHNAQMAQVFRKEEL